jgi:LacI family transcriptional regulator
MTTATLADIARKTRLSVAAVSKALNDRPDIAPATKARVRNVAERLAYRTNAAARALVTRRTSTLGVLVAFPAIPTVIERLRGIREAAQARSYRVQFAFHDGTADDELRQVALLNGQVDGLVVTPAHQHRALAMALRKMKGPVVLMSEVLRGLRCDRVGDDDRTGARLALEHLVSLGHRRVGLLVSMPGTPSDGAIERGWRDALSHHGIDEDDPALVRTGNLTASQTATQVDALLSLARPPTAILAFSDMAALWSMAHLTAREIRIPEEISLVGYDDTEFAALARVPLTSVAQPNFEIGRLAADHLLDRIARGTSGKQPRSTILAPRLVVRSSTGPCP